jgi:hypothetical protein
LPCGCLICHEKDVADNNHKCNECNQVFQVKYIQLNSNKGLKKLIEDQPYLNEEEITLKKELEASIGKLFQFYDEFYKHKLNRVQTDFKSITEFKPNLSLFNQERTSSFGSFKLQGFSNTNLLKSQILKDEQQLSESS